MICHFGRSKLWDLIKPHQSAHWPTLSYGHVHRIVLSHCRHMGHKIARNKQSKRDPALELIRAALTDWVFGYLSPVVGAFVHRVRGVEGCEFRGNINHSKKSVKSGHSLSSSGHHHDCFCREVDNYELVGLLGESRRSFKAQYNFFSSLIRFITTSWPIQQSK